MKPTISGFATKRALRSHINGGAASEQHRIRPIANELDIFAECLAEGLTLEEINSFMSQSDGYARSMLAKLRAIVGERAV